MRHHVAAVYAFARHADDLADEGHAESSVRLQQLDDWRGRLHAAVEHRRRSGSPSNDADEQVLAALGATIRACDLPLGLFDDLVSAFRQDVIVHRYERWSELLDYCRRSANPVGRLVLRIAGYRDERLDAASDCVCSALQLTNFLQDLDIDWQKGRLYLPADLYRPLGADERDPDHGELSPAWRRAVEEMSTRTRRLFDEGRAVCDGIPGRLGLELRLTWLGGRRILDRLRRSGYDPRAERPALGLADGLPIVWQAARWRTDSS